ncbi:MAG TPA: response regulator [Candidatus Eisenbacteria bacterium]
MVEDDADQRSAFIQRLRFEGYDAIAAADVPGAVQQARVRKPELILLDIGLPGGDGYLVMERLHSMPELADIPIVMLSARDAAKERPRALQSGAVGYYQKPVSNEVLRAAIASALAS